MNTIHDEIRRDLSERIIPFWKRMRDDLRGGYVPQTDFDLTPRPDADKGSIQNSRILWFFSEAYRFLGDRSLLDEADHAYAMLSRMTDPENGGVCWSLRADGSVADGTKHTYAQAFAVYGLAAYYMASGKAEALGRAEDLFRCIEKNCRDRDGYLEEFSADWEPRENRKLSGAGVLAFRTMNTLLHVLEAYTALYEASPDGGVRERLYEILSVFETKIYNPEKRRLEVFFDRDYRSLADLHSFGHDNEASWLVGKTLDVLADGALTARIRPLLLSLADCVYREAWTGSLPNEREGTRLDARRCWWVQAETLLGFLCAWEHTGEERYRDAVSVQWAFIRDHVIDRREGGEWFRTVDEEGRTTTAAWLWNSYEENLGSERRTS